MSLAFWMPCSVNLIVLMKVAFRYPPAWVVDQRLAVQPKQPAYSTAAQCTQIECRLSNSVAGHQPVGYGVSEAAAKLETRLLVHP